MAVQPLPPPNNPYDDHGDKPSQVFYLYLQALDMAFRTSKIGPLIGVAVPTNANAALAGVAVGQLYRGTADPAIVYIRTV